MVISTNGPPQKVFSLQEGELPNVIENCNREITEAEGNVKSELVGGEPEGETQKEVKSNSLGDDEQDEDTAL